MQDSSTLVQITLSDIQELCQEEQNQHRDGKRDAKSTESVLGIRLVSARRIRWWAHKDSNLGPAD